MLGRLGQRLGSRSGTLPCLSTVLEGNQRSFAVLSGKGEIMSCDIACDISISITCVALQHLVCATSSSMASSMQSQWSHYDETPAS